MCGRHCGGVVADSATLWGTPKKKNIPSNHTFIYIKGLLKNLSTSQSVNVYPYLASAMLDADVALATDQISNTPVSYFVTSNDAVLQNMLAHTGNYPDFYSSMADYAQNNDTSLLDDALYLYG